MSIAIAFLIASQGAAPITVNLERKVTGLDFNGTKERNQMYMPSSAKLDSEQPKEVTKLPAAFGTNSFFKLSLGNDPASVFVGLLQNQGDESRLFLDFNQNGDLTDDRPADWKSKPPAQEGGLVQWSGTNIFSVGYKAGNKKFKGEYGLNFYFSPGRSAIGYYRSTLLEGTGVINNKKVFFRLYEDGNNGVFNRRYDLSDDPATLKPVTLVIDESRKDVRGTFEYEGVNYLADISPDGSRLKLEPTFKIVKSPAKPPEPAPELLKPGVVAPDFEVDAYEGKAVKLSDYKGKVVVLKFWATWCGPCINSMPHFEQVYSKVKSQDVELLAVCVSDERPAFQQWVAKNKSRFSYPFFFDRAGKNTDAAISKKLYRVSGIPTVYIIDRAGNVAEAIVGFNPNGDERVESALKKLGVQV